MPDKQYINLVIADDDSDDRMFVIHALTEQGFAGNCLEFPDGDQLVKYLNNSLANLPDLILLDLNMPVKNGYITLNELKQNNHLQTIPVMILTSSSRQEDKRHCFKLGCDYFQEKPSTIDGYTELAGIITKHLIH